MKIRAYQVVPEWVHFPTNSVLVAASEWGRVFADDKHIVCFGPQDQLRWRLALEHIPSSLHLSGRSALVTSKTEEYHAWGYLGPAYLIDLEKGQLLTTLRGERALAVPGGFVLGIEGYDDFDSWLYDLDGQEVQHWRSYGHYFLEAGGSVRVYECDRQDSSRVVRLHPDGRIERGAALSDGQIPAPLELGDDRQLLLHGMSLQICDASLHPQELLRFDQVGPDPVHSALWRSEGGYEVGFIERHKDGYLTHRWSLTSD